MKPEHTVKGGVHSLTWTEDGVTATVSRIREDSRYNVAADVTIRLVNSDRPHIHEARMQISGTGSRRTVAKHCADTVNSLPWPGIIEDMCVLVIRQHRTGDLPVMVSDIEAPPELRYQIYPLLLQQQPTLVHGDGGSGKTTLAEFLCVLMDIGVDGCGLTINPARTLYLDWEADEVDFKQRILAIQKGLDVASKPDIWYRFCMQPLAGDIEAIQKIVAENAIDMVVVDSVGVACGGDLNDSQSIMAYFDALRTLKVTTLSIDHNNKEGKLYGNVYKTNRARLVWEVKKTQEPGESKLTIGVFDRKRNRGMLQKPLGFQLDFTDEAVAFSRVEVEDLMQDMSPKRQIEDMLRQGGMSIKDMLELSGMPDRLLRGTLRQNLSRFRRQGDKWVLTENFLDPVRDGL